MSRCIIFVLIACVLTADGGQNHLQSESRVISGIPGDQAIVTSPGFPEPCMLGKGSVYEIKFTARACDVRISFTYMDLSSNTVLKVTGSSLQGFHFVFVAGLLEITL